MTPSTPTPAMQTAASPTRTFCLGRFLIDLPARARLAGADYKYDFAQIEAPKAMSREQFDKELGAKEAALKATKHEVDPSLLRAVIKPDRDSTVLAFWEGKGTAGLVDVEGYRWINGTRFMSRIEVDDDKQASGVNRTQQLLSRLRPRADTDIPTDPGYCFEGGFIANERWRNEQVNVSFKLPEHPDAVVLVWFYPVPSYRRDPPLLDRVGGALGLLGNLATRVHVLRRGDRTVAGFKGQEYLVTGPNSGGQQGHSFIWETQGEGMLQDPAVVLEFQTSRRDPKGNPQKTRLSNEQALALWDRIVGSFRLRPVGGSPPQKTGDAAPLLPLGEIAGTGQICPQTGVWECVDSGDVQGGRRQVFRVGQVMPDIVRPIQPTLWQRLKGEQPVYRNATVWKLVEHLG